MKKHVSRFREENQFTREHDGRVAVLDNALVDVKSGCNKISPGHGVSVDVSHAQA